MMVETAVHVSVSVPSGELVTGVAGFGQLVRTSLRRQACRKVAEDTLQLQDHRSEADQVQPAQSQVRVRKHC